MLNIPSLGLNFVAMPGQNTAVQAHPRMFCIDLVITNQ